MLGGKGNCDGPLKNALLLMRSGTLAEIKAKIRALNKKETGLRGEKTILVVDGNSDVIHLIAVLLNRAAPEIKVLSGANGREGFDMLLKERVDLLVLNLMMPEMDGYQVLEQMLENRKLRKIPVLMCTCTAFKMSGYGGVPNPFGGMYVEWQKQPFNPETIVKRIRRMLMEGEQR